MEMKKKIRKKWVKALKSGKYQQGKESLRSRTNKFCCLGVLCDLAVREGVVKWKKRQGEFSIKKESSYLPDEVKAWAGLDSNQPSVTKGSLIQLNDDDGLSFKEIAKLIKKDGKAASA